MMKVFRWKNLRGSEDAQSTSIATRKIARDFAGTPNDPSPALQPNNWTRRYSANLTPYGSW